MIIFPSAWKLMIITKREPVVSEELVRNSYLYFTTWAN